MKKLMLVAFAAVSMACEPPADGSGGVQEELAPEFQGGGQQSNIGESVYPGPYGVGIGSTIANYRFFGYPRFTEGTPAQLFELADFFNPTGDEAYPAGSPFGEGTPKPRALLLDRSAVWCAPCQHEAEVVIPEKRALLAPGGEFFVTLDDGPTPGTAATQQDLTNWVTRFEINYPAVIDPNSTLSAVVGRDAYPGNVIVRTRDMKIIKWTNGAGGDAFWQTFQDVIDGKPISGVDF